MQCQALVLDGFVVVVVVTSPSMLDANHTDAQRKSHYRSCVTFILNPTGKLDVPDGIKMFRPTCVWSKVDADREVGPPASRGLSAFLIVAPFFLTGQIQRWCWKSLLKLASDLDNKTAPSRFSCQSTGRRTEEKVTRSLVPCLPTTSDSVYPSAHRQTFGAVLQGAALV